MARNVSEEDIRRIAWKVATTPHGNAKPLPVRRVVWTEILDQVRRTRDSFGVDDLRYNVSLTPRIFKRLFGKLCKSSEFPANLRETYEEAYNRATLPNCAPWREYLLTPQEAEYAVRLATRHGVYAFRLAVRDGEVPCYQFAPYARRFRPDDIKAYLNLV